ncbi:MAG: T9SS type A sorting domain-containing protein [Candidatus Marinimicrobia bacterium]|nr:T9SS type A sorting domain-containing protein [Candidatus Neomarinimicrobiota bacterium]
MKKVILSIIMLTLIAMPVFAQNLEDYVLETKGDTLVIKDYAEMEEANSIINAIELDENAPAGRVYELHSNGYYFITRTLNTPADRTIRIVGEDDTPLVASDSEAYPPLIAGTTEGEESINGNMIAFGGDLVMKNLMTCAAATDNSIGWTILYDASANNSVVIDNCLMEHTQWVFVQSNTSAGNSFYITNSYFVNMSGMPCRRNGGVYDNVSHNTDTMYVENNTHVMGQGMQYKFRNFPINHAYFNHNTFVNIGGPIFETLGYQDSWVVTNNLFVNSNANALHPNFASTEWDADEQPMGLVNLNHYPEDYAFDSLAAEDAERKVLVQNNGIYNDPKLDEIIEYCDNEEINGWTDWQSMMIKMNSRTQDMFDNDDRYPKLTESDWIEAGAPQFTDPMDLMDAQVDELITWCKQTADTANSYTMAVWRTADNPASENFVYADFPIPVDLSYSNSEYLEGGIDGLPLGDLNWFPAEKASWDKEEEYTKIMAALNSGDPVAIKESPQTIKNFELSQNYPNPFNPTTTIKYTVPSSEHITLKVYNALGQKVATLVDGFKKANTTHRATFNASNLSSGIYIYTLEYNGNTQSKKMVLIK